MLWIFLLVAFVLIYLAMARRLDEVDARLVLYGKKIKAAFQYIREDVQDVEAELEQELASSAESDLGPDMDHSKYEQELQAEILSSVQDDSGEVVQRPSAPAAN